MKNEVLKQLIDTVVSSLFDPIPICFYQQHEKGVAPIRKILSNNSPNYLITLNRTLIRNAFLLGCLDFTENSKVEYLIIGYGEKRGRGTDILKVEYTIGDEISVNISAESKNRISEYVQNKSKNEIIIFHNHPHNWINVVFDNIPLASAIDRNTLLIEKYLQTLILLKTILNKGSIRFYLGENGFVREFKTPNLLQTLISVNIG